MTPDEEVILALGPHLGDERAARIDGVAAARLAGVTLVLENLRDPHNGAAALRSAEAVGLCEVHVAGTPLRYSDRVTQGCQKWLSVVNHPDVDQAAAALAARGFRLYAAVPGAALALEAIDPSAPAAFLIGNEHDGLTPRARALAHAEYAIPLAGFSQSLNLSVATAITLYTHTTRRRAALGRAGDLLGAALDALRARYYERDVRGAEAILARWRKERGP